MLYSSFARRYLQVDSQSGDDWLCLCPFHRDRRPSFCFNVKKGVYICYACHEVGGIEKLMLHMQITKVPDVSLGDVVDALERHGQEKPERIYPERWLDQYAIDWDSDDDVVEHLRERHLKATTVVRFGLGCTSRQTAITIPIRNRDGALLGVYRRFLDGRRDKYKYPSTFKKSQHLYGYSECHRKRLLFITEGAFDALAFWNVGYESVAVYGSHMSAVQAKLVKSLSPRLLIVASDNDKAGDDLAKQITTDLAGLNMERMRYRAGETDPSSLHPLILRRRIKTYYSAA